MAQTDGVSTVLPPPEPVLTPLKPHQDPPMMAFLVKLTDSSLKALHSNRKTATALSVNLDPLDYGELVLGEQRFRFQTNDLERGAGQGGMEIVQKGAKGDPVFCKMGGVREKWTVMATKESFHETKQKALQLQVDEQKKAGKELKLKQHGSKKHSNSSIKTAVSEAAHSTKSQTGLATVKTETTRPKGLDFSNKSLRQRLTQILILKPLGRTELLERVKMSGGVSTMEQNCFDSILSEISAVQPGSNPEKVMLRPSVYREVDLNWPAFTDFDKKLVSRKLEGSKLGRRTMNAPTFVPPTTDNKTILDSLLPPTPNADLAGVKNGRKRPLSPDPPLEESPPAAGGKMQKLPPPPPRQKDQDVSKTGAPVVEEAGNWVRQKTIAKKVKVTPSEKPPPKGVSPPLPPQSPPSMPEVAPPDSPPPPEPNLEGEFPEIRTVEQRNDYAKAFTADYEEYLGCYKQLSKVSKEFRQLEDMLNKTDKKTNEYEKIERDITTRYDHYKTDAAFRAARRRHDALRVRLAFIKDRVKTYDQSTANQPLIMSDYNGVEHKSLPLNQLQNNEHSLDFTVM